VDLGLHGRIALVTGASQGIGAATARLLAAEGASIVVAYHRNAAAAELVAADVRAAGAQAWCVSLDMGDATDVQRAVAEVSAHTGGILDVVVLNAGANVLKSLDALEPDEWDDVIRTNLNGTFYLLRAVRPLLRVGGSVVTVASVAAQTGAPHHPAYAAAKAGIINLTKSAARSLAPDIRVNCVSPGLTRTSMGEMTVSGTADDLVAKLLTKRMAEPEEIARAIVFLASPAASFVYGATWDVNGGRDLR
jgi:NAD(P)-dependent dehydrogenase (short-subunit alcohol dehydrogenase family)